MPRSSFGSENDGYTMRRIDRSVADVPPTMPRGSFSQNRVRVWNRILADEF